MEKTISSPILILIIILALSACQNSAPISSSQNAEISITVTPSFTATSEPKETMTPTVNSATQTALAYDATSDAFFLTSKANTLNRKTAIAKTLSAKGILCESEYKMIPLYENPLIMDFYETDMDSWTVLGCYNEEEPSKAYIEVINQDNSKHYTISQEGLNLAPRHFLIVLHLDPKNNILFLKSRSINSGSGFDPSHYFGYGSDVYRLDLNNGDFKIILPHLSGLYYGQTVFSSDSHLIAFTISDEPNKISFLDSSTGKIVHNIALDGDFTRTGAFLWSEDGKQMIFAAGHQGWDEEENGIALYKLNLNIWGVTKILDSNTLRLVPAHKEYGDNIWLDKNTISLVDIFTRDWYKFNIVSGDLSEWVD